MTSDNLVEIVENLHKPIDERRLELLTRRNLGIRFRDIVEYLSVKYHVTEKAIYEDWRRRKNWAGKLVEINDGEQHLIDQKVFLDWLKREAVSIILDRGANDNAKVGAIRSARDILHDQYEIMKDTGKIRTVPDQLEVEQTIDVGWSDGDSLEDSLSLPDAPRTETLPSKPRHL